MSSKVLKFFKSLTISAPNMQFGEILYRNFMSISSALYSDVHADMKYLVLVTQPEFRGLNNGV